MHVVIDLPIPPSVNRTSVNLDMTKQRGLKKRSRAKSDDYKAWLDEAGWSLIMQRPKRLTGPVHLHYLVRDAGKFDIGNVEKPATDLLVKHRIIEDDNRKIVRKITLEWSADVAAMRVTITPEGEAA